MLVKNFLKKEIETSSLSKYLESYSSNNITYTLLKGNFFIDGNIFLPIEKNSYSTSLELFSISNPQKYSNYFKPEYLKLLQNSTKEIKILKRCFVIGNDNNYCHNLLYYIPRIISLLQNKEIISKIDYILFNKFLPKYFFDLINEILSIHKIKKELILIEKKLHLLEESYCPSFTGRIYDIEDNIKFWNRYSNSLINRSNNNERYDKIYISREDSNNRKIINEKEIVVYLEKEGFKSVVLSKLNIFDQINLFYKAKVVIGYHGAGFVNVIFSKKNTKVIELFPNSSKIIRKTFEVISKTQSLEHTYYYIDYISRIKNSLDLKDFDGVVNIKKFKLFLTSYLGNQYDK